MQNCRLRQSQGGLLRAKAYAAQGRADAASGRRPRAALISASGEVCICFVRIASRRHWPSLWGGEPWYRVGSVGTRGLRSEIPCEGKRAAHGAEDTAAAGQPGLFHRQQSLPYSSGIFACACAWCRRRPAARGVSGRWYHHGEAERAWRAPAEVARRVGECMSGAVGQPPLRRHRNSVPPAKIVNYIPSLAAPSMRSSLRPCAAQNAARLRTVQPLRALATAAGPLGTIPTQMKKIARWHAGNRH
ncbi:hypothetical protein BDV95DRAFT_106892 [Massariosphaeria phaeospora]|uniref:Uncharacterized protein n=1 Tax=Massariosphaeria phaeospora TaxID=100035 RepID=A0A7C8IBC8_9PLEO|nr:hypothetical protein BDV95DRAFT_106892 [Massariosphaeria phaeospora]